MNTTILGVALMLIICLAGGVCMFLVAHQTWKQETTTRESLNETLDDNNSIELWLGSPARASIFAYLADPEGDLPPTFLHVLPEHRSASRSCDKRRSNDEQD